MTYTKGKWTLVEFEHSWDIFAADDNGHPVICERITREGDANLLEAAPNLLEALEFVQKQAGIDPNSPTASVIQKAIAKAKGK